MKRAACRPSDAGSSSNPKFKTHLGQFAERAQLDCGHADMAPALCEVDSNPQQGLDGACNLKRRRRARLIFFYSISVEVAQSRDGCSCPFLMLEVSIST